MAFSHKPFTQIAVFDGAGAQIQTASPRNCFPPDIATPSEFFFGGDGVRTPVRAGSTFSCDLGDLDDIGSLVDAFTFSGVSQGTSTETVNIVALGGGRALQWYEDTPLELRQGNLAYDSARIETYSGKLSPSIYVDNDLLRYKNWGTLTGGSPDLPNGWATDITGTGTSVFNNTTFAADVATVSLDINTAPSNTNQMYLYANIPFGNHVGATITFTVTFNSLPANSDQIDILIQEADYAGVVGSISTTNVASTGTKTVSHTTVDSDLEIIRPVIVWYYSNGDYDPETTEITAPSITFSV